MEEQGKEVVKEINRHQEGSQGHGRGHQQGNGMHNQVVIQNTAGGMVHIGPSYQMQVVQQQQQQGVRMEPVDSRPVDKLIPPKESVRPLWYSSRVMQADELLRLSKNIGSGWKSVGNGLKFNWAQLEQFEADTRCQGEAIHRMLYRWLQWKDQKATVGRLTKVLFNHREYEAISCLQP